MPDVTKLAACSGEILSAGIDDLYTAIAVSKESIYGGR